MPTYELVRPGLSASGVVLVPNEVISKSAKSAKSPRPSKGALSKAGKTLASDGSSKTAKSKAGSTLGKG